MISTGYPALALMGSHVTDEIVDLLADARRIYVVTHHDEAGQRVAHRLLDMFGDRARVFPRPPKVKDVNELAMHAKGQQVFAELAYRVGFARHAAK